jgi:hypothetical protein
VYVEAPAALAIPAPAGWRVHRSLATRDAQAVLYRVGMD